MLLYFAHYLMYFLYPSELLEYHFFQVHPAKLRHSLRSVFKSNSSFEIDLSEPKSLMQTLSIIAVLTFANPHVYLDTVVLIGSISQQFSWNLKIAFATGASLASFIFFFSLGYGAKIFAPLMQRPISWRILDLLIAVIMFSIAIKLAYEGNWL